MRFETFYSQW